MNNPYPSCSPFYMSENEFAELLWENGQIVVHNHSKPSPSPSPPPIIPIIPHSNTRDRDTETFIQTSASFSNNRAKTNGHGHALLPSQDEDDIVPWINYDPLHSTPPPPDPLQPDFCSDFLEDFAGASPSTLHFTTTQLTAATSTATKLNKAEASLTPSRVRPLTSTVSGSELGSAPDKPFLPAAEKENTCKKRHDRLLASSSVCSENSEGFENTAPKHGGKRKVREGEESSSNSEEMEDDSVGGKRVSSGRGAPAKKSRAAEVHNMSERRRREKINEKMKALQELIPNCSKADKASMLDDAIEYLKSLQLQVQMMAMGSGMYMPPPFMMLPPMQAMRPPPLAHFSPVGMGMYHMGMGMGIYPPFVQNSTAAMHGMVTPMPLHPSMAVPATVSPQPTRVGSSGEDVAAGASVSSAFVRESEGAANIGIADQKPEML